MPPKTKTVDTPATDPTTDLFLTIAIAPKPKKGKELPPAPEWATAIAGKVKETDGPVYVNSKAVPDDADKTLRTYRNVLFGDNVRLRITPGTQAQPDGSKVDYLAISVGQFRKTAA